MDKTIKGPFGDADLVLSLPTADVIAAYRIKCGADVTRWFGDLDDIHLFECRETGYRFWRPTSIAGDRDFYAYISRTWKSYYHETRWEYPFIRKILRPSDRLLEVGCGRGFFLKSVEPLVTAATGLEFSTEAIADKVTKFDVLSSTVEFMSEQAPETFSIVCCFQVLEHVIDPYSFLAACAACLRPGGRLAIATPNYASATLRNREDVFDLPPHHVGHFSSEVYKRIAHLMGFTVEKIYIERKMCQMSEKVTERTQSGMPFRLARRASRMIMNGAYSLANEPGTNVLAILTKPR